MLFTKETDYAIRFFRTLQDGNQYPVGEIAEKEMIPQQFAYKILRKLSKAGYVKVIRGAKGGCILSADLKEVDLFSVIEAVEPKKSFIQCLEDGYHCEYRDQHGGCRVHDNLGCIDGLLQKALSKISIDQVLNGDLEDAAGEESA